MSIVTTSTTLGFLFLYKVI